MINTVLTIEKLHTKKKTVEPIIKFKPSVCQEQTQSDDKDQKTKEVSDRSNEGLSKECQETPDKEVENLNIQENNNLEAAVNEGSPTNFSSKTLKSEFGSFKSHVQDHELDSSTLIKPLTERRHSIGEIVEYEKESSTRTVNSTDEKDDRLHKTYLAKFKKGDRFAEAQSHYPDVRDIFAYPPSAFQKFKRSSIIDIKVRRRQSLSALDVGGYESGVRPPRSPLRPKSYSTKKSSSSMSSCSFEHRRPRSPKNTHKTSMDSGYGTLSRRRPISPYFTSEEPMSYFSSIDTRKSLENLRSMRSIIDICSSFDEQHPVPSKSTPTASKENAAFAKEQRNNRKMDEERIKLIQAIKDEGIKEKLSLRSNTNQIIAQYVSRLSYCSTACRLPNVLLNLTLATWKLHWKGSIWFCL